MTERLRYADGPTPEVSRVIEASPGDLSAYVADIKLPARFSAANMQKNLDGLASLVEPS